MFVLVAAQNLVTRVPRARAAVDPAVRAVRDGDAPRDLARVRPEVPHHRVGRLGDAALRPGVHLRRDGLDGLLGHRARRRRPDGRLAAADRHRAERSSAWPSRPRSRPSTSGRPTSTRARRPRSPRSWRWRRRRPPSAPSCASSTSRCSTRSADWAPGARRAGDDHDRRRQRRGARADLAQAPDGVVVGRAGGLHARGRRRRDAPRRPGDRLLPGRLPVHEPGGLRRDRHPRARDGARRRHRLGRRASGSSARCWPGR